MKNLVSLVLLVAGVAMIIFGISASESLGSELSRFFTGTPTDKTVWLLIGGVAATIAGLSGLALKAK